MTRPGARTAICLSTLGLAAVAPSLAAIQEPVRFDADELARIVRQNAETVLVNAGEVACHSGPNFTNGAFRATGVPPFVGQAAADDGLYAGLRTLRATRFNLQGRYSDDTTGSTARSGEKRRPGDDERDLRRVDLSAGDVEDLVAFLHTLTDADGARRPLAPLEAAPCD